MSVPTQYGKPLYCDRFPCQVCRTGYLDCAAMFSVSMKCCSHCAHPERWTAEEPYSGEELRDMALRYRPRA